MSELWIPGTGSPEDFVRRLLHRIEAFAERHGQATVEVELRDGSTLVLDGVAPEPGYGFVTLLPHADEPQEVIVPLAMLARVTITPVSERHPLGFAT